jgi:hypothetical protein
VDLLKAILTKRGEKNNNKLKNQSEGMAEAPARAPD